MRRLLSVFLLVLFLFSFAACASVEAPPIVTPTVTPTPTSDINLDGFDDGGNVAPPVVPTD